MRYNKIARLLPGMLLLATLIAGAVISDGKGRKSDRRLTPADSEASRKADYIYMEAMAHNAGGDDDAYFELLNASYKLDTTETGVGQTLGYYLMALGRNDSTMATEGYLMMKRHFDLHPDDYYSTIFYGMVNTTLGNTREAIRVWSAADSLYPDKPDVAIKLVEALQENRDTASLRRSLDVLARIERVEGKDLGLTSHKIRALLALRDTASSVTEINSLIASSPRNVQYQLYAGDIFMVLDRPDKAIELYDMACATDSTNGLAYYKRAQYYLQQGDSLAYDREVSRALLKEEIDVEAKSELLRDYVGRVYADSLRRPQITGIFESLIEQHPHESSFRDLYSSYLIVVGDLRGAAEQQEYAVDGDLYNASRWRSIMSLYGQLDDSRKALTTGKQALEYLPTDEVITLLMGANYQQLKQYDEAAEYYHKAIDLTDKDDISTCSQLIASLGDIFYAREMTDSAFAYYRQAVEIDPDNLLALNNFAYYLAENDQDLDLAERYSAICVRANPENDTAIDTYAWIFYKKKDYVKAKEWIDQAVSLEEEHPQADVLHHAGDIYFMNRDVAKAVEFWEKALKLEPDNQILKKKIRQRTPFVD
ncbi:MAG: tetratricopeptide repeat protein [Muribaculaceae bacterium]|nr:tetratricopeptide repeat protein [Muribaculaceae bacterium]